MIPENKLRSLVKKIVRENVMNYRGGAHAKLFAGGDQAFNIPQIDGVDVDIDRIGNDLHNPYFGVTIEVKDFPELSVNMQVFKDEEEAKKFARDKIDHIRSVLQRENSPR